MAVLSGGAVLVAGSVAAGHGWIRLRTRSRVVTRPVAVNGRRAAVVLGAGVRPDGRPTTVLARRVEGAAELWHLGAVSELVMSGAADANGDQPAAMTVAAVGLGVDAGCVVADPTGVNTAATCRAAAARYGDEPIVLVTQAFHARRTAYLARRFGLDAVVLALPDRDIGRRARRRASRREVPAAVKAVMLDRP
ncbi:MAG: vancomycin high temperature exclusion protein [Acidimicrobiales bacterium]